MRRDGGRTCVSRRDSRCPAESALKHRESGERREGRERERGEREREEGTAWDELRLGPSDEESRSAVGEAACLCADSARRRKRTRDGGGEERRERGEEREGREGERGGGEEERRSGGEREAGREKAHVGLLLVAACSRSADTCTCVHLHVPHVRACMSRALTACVPVPGRFDSVRERTEENRGCCRGHRGHRRASS